MERGEPVKIGVLLDMPEVFSGLVSKTFDLVVEQYHASGRFERGFEFVTMLPFGPPAGSIQNTVNAYHALCDQGCIAVIGLFNSDDNIALPPYADARQVPLIGQGATAGGMSEWTFSVGWSSIPHDAYCVAGWLKKRDYKRVVLTWDRAHHASEYVENFRRACARAGVTILTDVRFPQLIKPELPALFAEAVEKFRALKPDALAHFGTGWVASHWAKFVNDSGWDVPRIMNDAFFGAAMPGMEATYEGWVGTTTWDDDNPVTAKLFDDYCARYTGDPAPPREAISVFRDGITALLEGIMLAPILTPEGVKRGLEMVQLLPSAVGGPSTCIGFAPHAHRGHQGADVMVVRRMKGGQLIMEERIDLF